MSTGYTHANYLHLGVAAPNPRASASMSARPAPLQAGAWSMRRGLRVEAVNSFEGGFVWGAQAMDSLCRGRAKE